MDDPVMKAMAEMANEKGAGALGVPGPISADDPANSASDLVADGLVKIYGDRTVVNGVSMRVRCGEIVGLLGPNGAGKTTTFYMIVGLVRPNRGTVKFRGQDLTNLPVFMRARRGLGYLAQEASIFRKLSVWDNVMAILETLKMSKADRKARCEELLSSLDLMKVAKQPAYTLSGGERRKLEIARAGAASVDSDAGRAVRGRGSACRARHPGDCPQSEEAGARHHHHGPQRARDAQRCGPGLPGL